MNSRIQVRDGFWILLAAFWCVDSTNVLPLFLLAAAAHEAGHLLILYCTGGRLHQFILTTSGAVMRCILPEGRYARAAICLAGPAASFLLTTCAEAFSCWRLAGASALLGLFNLLPLPPLDGGMALYHLTDGKFSVLRKVLSVVSIGVLEIGGLWLIWHKGGCWLFLFGMIFLWKQLQDSVIH